MDSYNRSERARTTRLTDNVRTVVVGYGVQGHKRAHHAGLDLVAVVDPVHAEATHRELRDVPVSSYDAALVCTPDEPKIALLEYLLGLGKHVLVEKPLDADQSVLERLQASAESSGAVCYTAYNHRFEPHFVRLKKLIDSGELGRIYSCRLFYGNGTARLVRESEWRDTESGVVHDLGSHLLDTCRFWFGDAVGPFSLGSAHAFENRSPDHAVIVSENTEPRIELEMTLCMWRNHFTCDVLAENGSAHIDSLCKWGPSTFTHRTRVLPSGRPTEVSTVLVEPDPTWALEYEHFRTLVLSGAKTDLATDVWIHSTLSEMSEAWRAESRT